MIASIRSSRCEPLPSAKSGTMTSSRPTSCQAATASATCSVVPAMAARPPVPARNRSACGGIVGEADQRLRGAGDGGRDRGRSPRSGRRARADRSAMTSAQAPHVPLVGVPGDDAHHPVALAADEERQRVLHRLRLGHGVGHRGSARRPPWCVGSRSSPGCTWQPSSKRSMRSPGEPELDAVLLVLVLLPAGADAEQEPPAADVVDGGGPLRQHGGVPVGHAEHEGAEAHPVGGRGQRAERGGGLEGGGVRATEAAAVAHEVVGDVDAVPPGGLGVAGDLEDVGPGLLEVRPDREPHVRRSWPRRRSRCSVVRATTSSGSIAGKSATRSWLRPSLR